MAFLCAGYCSPNFRSFADFETKFNLTSIQSMHQNLFWNANGKVIPSMTEDYFGFLDETPRDHHANSCYTSKVRLNFRCRNILLSVLQFASKHNFTIDLHQINAKNMKYLKLVKSYSGPEVLAGSLTLNSPSNLPLLASVRMPYSNFDSHSVYYCRTEMVIGKKPLIVFGIWYEAFSQELWWLLFAVIMLVVICLYQVHRYLNAILVELLLYVSVIFGHGAESKTRNLLIILSLQFLCLQMYGNGLTSIVTVAELPHTFTTIEELLLNNYKIVFLPKRHLLSLEKVFAMDFNSIRYSFKDAFYVVDDVQYEDDMLKLLLDIPIPLAMTTQTSHLESMTACASSLFRRLLGSPISCSVVKQTLATEIFLWWMKTENQFWLYATFQQILGSGLFYKWNEWSYWHKMLIDRDWNEPHQVGSDTVNFTKFASIMIAWSAAMLISFVVLIFGKGEFIFIYIVMMAKRCMNKLRKY
ncbi:unnamed protein product [Orchesella dallaii]|uniref:Uncharacterized protein n=1 Tax=Orchesella dallaii TaxID=48710 RepID=A0ABP1RXE0_9HEXA